MNICLFSLFCWSIYSHYQLCRFIIIHVIITIVIINIIIIISISINIIIIIIVYKINIAVLSPFLLSVAVVKWLFLSLLSLLLFISLLLS